METWGIYIYIYIYIEREREREREREKVLKKVVVNYSFLNFKIFLSYYVI